MKHKIYYHEVFSLWHYKKKNKTTETKGGDKKCSATYTDNNTMSTKLKCKYSETKYKMNESIL